LESEAAFEPRNSFERSVAAFELLAEDRESRAAVSAARIEVRCGGFVTAVGGCDATRTAASDSAAESLDMFNASGFEALQLEETLYIKRRSCRDEIRGEPSAIM
jgi:hypothetical protein